MWSCLLLIALAATPCAQQQAGGSTDMGMGMLTVDDIGEWLEEAAELDRARDLELLSSFLELGAQVETLKNATSQLLEELDIVRSRQAASAAVQASQVIMMVAYFLTILSVYIVKRCQKMSEKSKRKEFERLEMQLRSSKSKRRAAAAKEKSAPAQSLE